MPSEAVVLISIIQQGTVTNDVARAVQEAKQGHIKFKMDNTSNVHVGLGKVLPSSNRILYLKSNICVMEMIQNLVTIYV